MKVDIQDLSFNQKVILRVLEALPPKSKGDRMFFEKFLFVLSKINSTLFQDICDTFEPHHAGPYNEYVDEVIQGLSDRDLIQHQELTRSGVELVEKLRDDPEFVPALAEISELEELLRGFNLDDVLYLAYKLYPDYAVVSKIQQHVRSDTLESYEIPLAAMADDEELIFESDKGSRIKVVKKGRTVSIEPVPSQGSE